MELSTLAKEIREGTTIPYLGIGVFEGINDEAGNPMPYDGDSMILALNNGRAMPPRLMYEYTRAAMHIEQRRGRPYLEQQTEAIYARPFAMPETYAIINALGAPYVVDTNRDGKLQELLADRPHQLVQGKARIIGDDNRFVVYAYHPDSKSYQAIDPDALDPSHPVLFKPMGCGQPEPGWIISDADFVDWLTEAMGGYAIPPVLKNYRKGKKYLILGVGFSKDTERMVANEITADLEGGYWLHSGELTKNEKKFVENHNLEVVDMPLADLLAGLKKEIG